MGTLTFAPVRRRIFWNERQRELREGLAHLIGFRLRRAGGNVLVAFTLLPWLGPFHCLAGLCSELRWSEKFGLHPKMYSTRMDGCENDEAMQLVRHVSSKCGPLGAAR